MPLTVSGLAGVAEVSSRQQLQPCPAEWRHGLGLGRNSSGQLGNGTTTDSAVPVAVSGLSGVVAVAAGQSHALALLSTGKVMAWGDNQTGELGDGSTEDSTVPVEVPGLSGVTAISAGWDYSLALLGSGSVEAWGENLVGQLGVGTSTGPETCEVKTPCSRNPLTVTGLSGITAISAGGAGGEHALALRSSGTVAAWGANYEGQLGNGSYTGPDECAGYGCSTEPVSVSGLTEATAIAAGGAGGEDSLAVLGDGTVKAWGSNNSGQLGVGTGSGPETCALSSPCSTTPVAVTGLTGVASVSAGTEFNLALLTTGSAMAWGDDEHGDSAMARPAPKLLRHPLQHYAVPVSGLSGATGVSAGENHSLAFGPDFAQGQSLQPSEELGLANPGEPNHVRVCAGDPVNCATGNLVESQTDLSVSGRGVTLTFTRTYNAQAAVTQTSPGLLGYGWSTSFSDHLTLNPTGKTVTVVQANGSTVRFAGTPGCQANSRRPNSRRQS